MPAALVGAATPDAASAMHVEATHALLTLQQARDTAPEVIPGYETTLRYLRSLEPRPSAGEAEPDVREDSGLRVQLVVDETRTPIGRDFFEEFYRAWEPPENARDYTIQIQEQPVPGLGVRIVALLDGELLFQLPLQPRFEIIREMARQAAEYVRGRLEDRRATRGSVGGGTYRE